MDKVSKFFQKLTIKERTKFLEIKKQVKSGSFTGLDVSTIKSNPDLFRVRIRLYRLIFSGRKSGNIELIKIVKRDSNTYKNL